MKRSLEEFRVGAIGSILDEYKRAMAELRFVLENIDAEDYKRIVEGESEHCHSIEVIMNHVVRAGYGYSNYIREALSLEVLPIADKQIPQNEIGAEIEGMMTYCYETFESDPPITDEQVENVYFVTRWDIKYNIDQLMEHAIVHVLRHRRQIEKFMLLHRSKGAGL